MNSLLHLMCSLALAAPSTTTPAHSAANVVELARSQGSFELLLAAADKAGLVGALTGDEHITVFAPTDEAFRALPDKTLEALLRPENKDQLAAVLTYHVVAGRVDARQALAAGSAASLQGGELAFKLEEGRLRVNDASVIANDLASGNGLVHAIDSVLLPPGGLDLAPKGRLIIGVYSEKPGRALASQLGIDRNAALLVTRLTGKAPAERAGVEQYDIITSIDGVPATEASLKDAKARVGFGGTLELGIIRHGHPVTLHVEVGVDRH